MLRSLLNHWALRLHNDDDDEITKCILFVVMPPLPSALTILHACMQTCSADLCAIMRLSRVINVLRVYICSVHSHVFTCRLIPDDA